MVVAVGLMVRVGHKIIADRFKLAGHQSLWLY